MWPVFSLAWPPSHREPTSGQGALGKVLAVAASPAEFVLLRGGVFVEPVTPPS